MDLILSRWDPSSRFVSSRWTNLGERIRSLMDWIEQMETKITSTRDMHVEDLLAKLENVRLLALLTKGNLSHDYRCLIAQLLEQWADKRGGKESDLVMSQTPSKLPLLSVLYLLDNLRCFGVSDIKCCISHSDYCYALNISTLLPFMLCLLWWVFFFYWS